MYQDVACLLPNLRWTGFLEMLCSRKVGQVLICCSPMMEDIGSLDKTQWVALPLPQDLHDKDKGQGKVLKRLPLNPRTMLIVY